MSQLSINEMTTYRWSFEEDVRQYRAAGISAIGVWRQKLADFGEEKGIELLAESGLDVSNLLWAGPFTGSDGHTYRESIRDAEEAIRLAGALHAGSLVVYTGARNGHTLNHARRLFIDAVKSLLPLAHELDVTLAVEPMSGPCAADWTFLTGLDAALELIDAIDSPQFKLAFDTYHLGHDARTLARLREIASRVAIVHLGDGRQPPDQEQNRHRLGEGLLPLREIITTLVGAGYEGYFDVELMGEDIEATDYRELLASSKRAFAELTSGLPSRVAGRR